MKIPDNIYMNICKVFQEIYKNKFELNELNIAEVGSRGKNMTCRYRITVQKEMQNVKFSYYDAAVYDAVYTLYKTNYSKFTLTDLLRVMSGDEKVRFESRGWKNKVHAVNKKLCAILDIYKKCGYVTEYELLRNEPRSLVRGLEILGEIKKVELRKKRETETSAEKTAEVK